MTKKNKKTTLARLFSLSLTFLASLEVLKKNKKERTEYSKNDYFMWHYFVCYFVCCDKEQKSLF